MNFRVERPQKARFAQSLILALIFLSACNYPSDEGEFFFAPTGKITDPKLNESSGLARSNQYENVLWTHNDDGGPLLFAIHPSGEILRTYLLNGITNNDWEDIASYQDKLYLYDNVSRIENNNRGVIHVLQEPDPFQDDSVKIEASYEIRFPISGEDVETIIVDSGRIYLVSKPWDDSYPRIYILDELNDGKYAQRLTDLPYLAMITGGDISEDGQRIALLSYRALFVFQANGSSEQIFEQEPLICRLNAGQVEGITWSNEDLLVSTEQGNIYLIPKSRWGQQQAPFQECPVVDLPLIPAKPDVSTPMEQWSAGTWLSSQDLNHTERMGRIAWNESGLHIGISLDSKPELALLNRFIFDDFDSWFEAGRVYLLFNPSGTRPMSFGPDDRCIVIGREKNGSISALALELKPSTYVQDYEDSPEWISIQESGNRILLTLTPDTPGIKPFRENREFGFNLLITENTSRIISWSPLTTRFSWDAPSIWGLLRLKLR